MLSSEDVKVLEKKRVKYKLNRFFKTIFPLSIILIIGLLGYLFYPKLQKIKDITIDLVSNKDTKEKIIEIEDKENEPFSKEEKIEKKVIVVEKKIEKREEEVKTEKKASSNMIENANTISSKKEKDNTLKLHTSFLTILDKEPKIDNSELMTQNKKKAVIKIDSKKIAKRDYNSKRRKKVVKDLPKDVKIDFEGKNVDYLKKRFKKTNKFKYSIAIAEEYYQKKMYKQSIKWSLISNDINNKDARSWIFFAKSKVKLNQRGEAMEALKLFLKDNKSRAASKLLSRIKNGAL